MIACEAFDSKILKLEFQNLKKLKLLQLKAESAIFTPPPSGYNKKVKHSMKSLDEATARTTICE